MNDYDNEDEVEVEVVEGRFARVLHTSDSPPTVYFKLGDGTVGHATSNQPIAFETGSVVFVSDSSMRSAPDDLWNPEPQIAVVRLKLDDITIVDTGGRWIEVPTVDTVEYGRGNTVHVTKEDGVLRKLDDEPLRFIEFPDLTDEVVTKFKIPAPKESFDNLGGLDDVIERAKELIEVPLEYGNVLEKIGARPIRGVLLTGPSGTGKTLFARIMAAQSGATFYLINGPEIMSKWYGQSEELLRMIFADARKQRSIVFFDEIDSVAGQRTDTANEASNRIVATLLTELDGFSAGEHELMVLATTNRPEDVDEAIRRPGRFDWQIHFSLPDLAGRTDILRKTMKGKRAADDLPLEAIATQSEGWSGAELNSIWTEAALLAVQDGREQIEIEDFFGGWERAVAQRAVRAQTTRRGGQ
ncbi:ATP-binding protein [Actinobacteria bacterium YIM 96077]|uniref:26S protease regulatory subunit n=1 Tax=Phytoactinopolyspora halophila TaxID=1981511 RepID=A0A329QZS4_9ACTN|nr:AAA family ATPase [Phytoactinopolyspora halophila]AYY13127.1 ATP-binding protein [Actinobacteria bacterium YIM 96077]RAW17633.1 26S protease regulatory subunit [Phytoactinopolyspora halophila]